MLTYFLRPIRRSERGQRVNLPDIGRRATSIGMEPVPGRLFRAGLGGSRPRSYLILGDAAVAVLVEPQDELARFADELLARDLAILIFVKIAEVRVDQCGVRLFDGCKLGGVEASIVVTIGEGEYPVEMLLPFIAGVDAIMIGVPTIRPGLERIRTDLVVRGSGLGEGDRCAGQKQSERNANPADGFPERQISLLFCYASRCKFLRREAACLIY